MKHSTQMYQYRATDGSKFATKHDREHYEEKLMEKKAMQQEMLYMEQDREVPNWLWPDETHEC